MAWFALPMSRDRVVGLFVCLAMMVGFAVVLAIYAGNAKSKEDDVMVMARAVDCQFPSDEEFCKGEEKLKVSHVTHAYTCGDTVTKEETSTAPTFTLESADENKKYVLVMVDPDAHSAVGRYFLHWALKDITTEAHGRVRNYNTIIEYVGPSPPSDTHRYQFLLYEQPADETGLPSTISKRSDFNLAEFIKKANLCELVGTFQYNVESEKKSQRN